VQRAVKAARAGWVGGMATREIGLVVVELGGGRTRADDVVDHRVALTEVAHIGRRVEAGDTLAIVHAADVADVDAACTRLVTLIDIHDSAPALTSVLIERLADPHSSPSDRIATR
jgi:thymidine phosphorylase